MSLTELYRRVEASFLPGEKGKKERLRALAYVKINVGPHGALR